MSHWIIAPVLIPALLAAIMVLAMRHHLVLQRTFSVAGAVALLAVAAGMAVQTADGTIVTYELGDWAAPYGILLVADRLTSIMLLLTSILGVAVVLHVIGTDWDKRGRHFHALFMFQLMGILGAFLTGDAFNLFVFFEVLLIASYGLLIHSGGAQRTRAGVQYVVYNLLGSTLFLFALGTIYSVTGTLNMADLAQRVAELPAEDTALLRVGAVLLLLVFAVKAAVLPLHFWLPSSYAAAPAPVAALFAIMTKVGAYAILRMYTLVFPADLPATQGTFDLWLMPAALLTLAVGMIGVLGARRFERLAAFAVIGSMGTLLTAIALFTPEGTRAALYYMVHSTFASAALFLVVDLTALARAGQPCQIAAPPPVARRGLVAAMFFAAGIAITGMPPLSGFLGKLLVLDAAQGEAAGWWIWAVVLTTSLIAVVGFGRAGSAIFWRAEPVESAEPDDTRAPGYAPGALPYVATGGLIAMIVSVTVFAGPLTGYLEATSDQLIARTPYIDAVLGSGEEIE